MTAPTDPASAPAPRGLLGALENTGMSLAILGIALLATSGACGLFEPTETRYAEIAREMLATRQWLVPRLDGLAHFHKPPFVYWSVAASFAVFGVRDAAARVPVALATLATLAFTALAARRRFAAIASPAATLWIFGTMALPFAFGRTIATDPFLAAMVAGWWALAPSVLALALLGLGFFIKGPVVFVPTILPVLVAAALARDRRMLRLAGPPRGWLALAAIATPWFLIVTSRFPGLLRYLLENQIWDRFTTHIHHRGGPPWYFALVFLAGTLPWTPAVLSGLARAWNRRDAEPYRLALAWIAVPLVFFSFSGSKLPAYLLPTFPAIAMLAADAVERASRRVRVATALACVVLAGCGALLGPRLLASAAGAHGATALPRAVWIGLAFWAYAAVWVVRGRAAWAGLVLLLGWTAILTGLAPFEAVLGSPRPLVRLLAEHRGPSEPVVEYHRFDSGLPFYLGERVRLLDVERELFFTPAAERDSIVLTRAGLVALVGSRGRAWLLAPRGEGAGLADSLGLGYTPLASWQREALGSIEARMPSR